MDFTLSPSYKYLQEEKAIIFEVTKWLDIQLLPSDAIKGTKQNSNSSQRTFKFAKYIMKKPHCAAIWALSCPHSYSHTSWRLEKNNHPALSWHEKDAKGPCLSHKLMNATLVWSDYSQRRFSHLKSIVFLSLWSLLISHILWKDARWWQAIWSHYSEWSLLIRFWFYMNYGYWFQKKIWVVVS